jgi:hypothetical protein
MLRNLLYVCRGSDMAILLGYCVWVTDYSYKSIPFIGGEVDKCILWLSFTQGDQIGRMFDHRVAEYFGQFTIKFMY